MERRLCNRINALLDAEEQVLIEDGTQLVPSTLLNLGEGGALLEFKDSDSQLPAGGTFHILFDNGGELLEVTGSPMRTDGSRTAFRFSDLTEEQKKAIRTKMIRMAIISSRVPEEERNKRQELFSESEFLLSSAEILESNGEILVGE